MKLISERMHAGMERQFEEDGLRRRTTARMTSPLGVRSRAPMSSTRIMSSDCTMRVKRWRRIGCRKRHRVWLIRIRHSWLGLARPPMPSKKVEACVMSNPAFDYPARWQSAATLMERDGIDALS